MQIVNIVSDHFVSLLPPDGNWWQVTLFVLILFYFFLQRWFILSKLVLWHMGTQLYTVSSLITTWPAAGHLTGIFLAKVIISEDVKTIL